MADIFIHFRNKPPILCEVAPSERLGRALSEGKKDSMVSQAHSVRQLFHKIVADCYAKYTGLRDAELTYYVADLLADFTDLDRLYRLRDEQGMPIEDLSRMLFASDPVYGSATSFVAEREIRKHIGDYSLFHAGMYPEMFHSSRHGNARHYQQMVQAGKSSYFVVSQFNVCEFAAEAPLFERLAENFELCIYGLNKVRGEFERLCGPAVQDAQLELPV